MRLSAFTHFCSRQFWVKIDDVIIEYRNHCEWIWGQFISVFQYSNIPFIQCSRLCLPSTAYRLHSLLPQAQRSSRPLGRSSSEAVLKRSGRPAFQYSIIPIFLFSPIPAFVVPQPLTPGPWFLPLNVIPYHILAQAYPFKW
jgi:hypothetical protein